MSEQESFLKDLDTPEKDSILDLPLAPEKEEETKEENSEESEMQLRNRRERRLAAKLQAERESSIRLAERLAVISEAKNLAKDTDSEYLKGIEKIYGTETPEAVAATELLRKALVGVKEESKKEALAIIREEQRKAQEEVEKESRQLDSMVEDLEDEYGIDLNQSQRKEFFATLHKMSPKDENGNVIHYADHHAVWDIVKSKSTKTENRAKDLSSRSMVQSGASKESTLKDDSTQRFLREEGII